MQMICTLATLMAKLVATRPFRFGVVSSDAATAEKWTAKARRAEELGYDVFLVPDHLSGMLSTVPALAAAAAATSKIRIGSFVFDTRLRDPAVLTHEVATLDLLSEGRFEVGLGAGHMRSEYESAGIGFTSPGDRLAQLEQAFAIMKAVLGTNEPITVETSGREVRDFGDFPRGPQAPPPILIGGGSPKILRLAAREADIVSIVPRSRADGGGLDSADMGGAAFEEKVEIVRAEATARSNPPELNTLLQAVEIVPLERRDEAAARLSAEWERPAQLVLESPFVLIGPVPELAEQLLERRERLGISYVAVFDDAIEDFASVVHTLKS
jgi:probable F420-dependent oxidoreductase